MSDGITEMYKEAEFDPVVEAVVQKFRHRSYCGMQKYGVSLERNDIDLHGWLNHLQEELMDAINYIERLKRGA